MPDVKKLLSATRRTPHSPDRFVSTGSTLLDLAISGRAGCGYLKGHYYHIVGDSSSGKTWFSVSCLAEAANNPMFDDYRLVHDCPEDGAQMDILTYFGSKAASRIEPPRRDKAGEAVHSGTVEDFYFNLDDALDGKPCIYVLDSMDALDALADVKKFEKTKKTARRRENRKPGAEVKEDTGSYGTEKAKLNSTRLRLAVNKLKKTGSILIIISQTRDKIGGFGFDKKTLSGGRALKFYATLQLWLSVAEPLKKPVRGKMRSIGAVSLIQTKKNRITGRDRKVKVPFYHSIGIDDAGGCVDYLLEEEHWKKGSKGISAPEFAFHGTREELVAEVQNSDSEPELRKLVAGVWQGIEKQLAVIRRPRYE